MPRRTPLFIGASLCALILIVAAAVPGRGAVPVLIIDGRGFGHGVGMAQDGAYWMGRAGASTEQILGHFYPGTGLGRAGGTVRVAVLTTPARETVLSFPTGGEVRDARSGQQSQGFPVRVAPGGSVRLRFDGSRYVVEPLSGAQLAASARLRTRLIAAQSPGDATTTTGVVPLPTTTSTTAPQPVPGPTTTATTAPPPPPPGQQPPPPAPTAAVSSRPLWALPGDSGTLSLPARGRRYRGLMQAIGGAGVLRLVNEVDVELYLRGMGEVRDPRWPPAALRAQAIAARTYALRAMAASGELCDTQRCQVYLGADAEYGAMNRAVADSSGRVVVHGRSLASAVYSANGGGHSASPEEGFGTGGGHPYLRPAPYLTEDPSPWTVEVALRDVATRFGYPGELTEVRVGRTGPSGRALDVVLEGSAGSRSVPGLAFDARLGLKSTLFSLRLGTADVAPPPPPPGEELQLPPEAAGPATPVPGVPELPGAPGGEGRSQEAGATPAGLRALAVLLNASVAVAAGDRLRRGR